MFAHLGSGVCDSYLLQVVVTRLNLSVCEGSLLLLGIGR